MVTCANLLEQLLADDNISRVVRDSQLDGYSNDLRFFDEQTKNTAVQ